MISCLRGILYEYGNDSIIIDVNGAGYEVLIHQRAFSSLPQVGDSLFIYTHLQVLENEFKLYGFLDKEELKLFKKLLGVSGMGAKGAMNVLAFMEPFAFYQAVVSLDEKLLTKIPGIGKKSAGRIIFELKDKIEGLQTITPDDSQGGSIDEVLQALETLGYGRSEVYSIIMELQRDKRLGDSVEENIKLVLKMKARQMK